MIQEGSDSLILHDASIYRIEVLLTTDIVGVSRNNGYYWHLQLQKGDVKLEDTTNRHVFEMVISVDIIAIARQFLKKPLMDHKQCLYVSKHNVLHIVTNDVPFFHGIHKDGANESMRQIQSRLLLQIAHVHHFCVVELLIGVPTLCLHHNPVLAKC